MGKYTRDGGVISSKLPISQRPSRGGTGKFGVYRGIVNRAVFPEDPDNSNGERMEYRITVQGQEYPNAIYVRDFGGVYNYHERILKGVEKSYTGAIEKSQYHENLDGEIVWVLFVEGRDDVPLIIGTDRHPRQKTSAKKEEGLQDIQEFNGVEFLIDKDSNYSISSVGRKDPDGKILNPEAVGSNVLIDGKTGDITVATTEKADEVRIKFTKKDKILELVADKNQVLMNAEGIKITDETGNVIVMKSGEVDFIVKGAFNVTTDGAVAVTSGADATITAKGNANISGKGGVKVSSDAAAEFAGKGGTKVGSGAAPTDVLGAVVNLAGGGAPVARLGDMVIGTGNLGAPVVSQIMQGSPKVTSG